MIESLTKEQTDKFPVYVEKWLKIGLSTEPCDFEAACKHAKDAYKVVGLKEPEFFIGPMNNPYEGGLAEIVLQEIAKEKLEFKDHDELNKIVQERVQGMIGRKKQTVSITNQIYGNHEFWLSFYDFFHNECAIDLSLIQPLIELSKVCGWWTPLENVVILQHRPLELHFDDQQRLHNTTGPAIKYRGSSYADVYAVHGVRVPKKVIDRDFDAKDIQKEENAEVRRVMIEFYGQERFISEIKADVVHSDDFGTLLRVELPGDEPLMMVKVVNSTQEPDGTYKDYFIRVDPNAYGGLKTARAAVASTWRNPDGSLLFKSPEDYDCAVET